MNSVHDMGGMHGLGPVIPEPEGSPFHSGWDARVHAMNIASPTRANIDAGRHQREKIPGPEYLAMSYYEKWFRGLSELLVLKGFVTAEEMASGRASAGSTRHTPILSAAMVTPSLSQQGSYVRLVAAAALFSVGDAVRALTLNPPGHTRLPRYARGRSGVVTALHGAHVFPDAHAHDGGEDPRQLYTVRFSARELWGAAANPRDSVSLDLWEPYLERD